MSVRIVLAQQHHMLREGLRILLEKQAGVEVVAVVEDGREAVDRALALLPDVAVLDMRLPRLNGVEVTRRIKAGEPGVAVLALANEADRRMVGQILQAGASGCMLKSSPFDELLRAIRAVASGQTYLSSGVADLVVECYVRGGGDGDTLGNGSNGWSLLTRREREVLQLLAEGHEPRQVAGQLNLSVKTIDTHRYQVMKKLKLRGLVDLTRYALREGITSLDT